MKMLFKLLLLCLTLIPLSLGSVVFADDAVDGRAGRAEVRFLEGMIDHHQMALDMAVDCLTKAESESVRTLCQNIVDAQSREIQIMRGWLLSWYGVEYTPVSMLHNDQADETASGCKMQCSMMGEGMGMMEGGGMMQNGGMGMMGGGQSGMGRMGSMSVERTMHVLSIMGSLTVGDFLQRTDDRDPATPLMDVFDTLIASGDFSIDMGTFMPRMGSMTQEQLMAMFDEMHNLTREDIQEMQGHLDEGADAALSTMMLHHMEVMAGGSANAEQNDEHSAHHPEGAATTEAEAPANHSDHQSGTDHSADTATQGGDDSPHQPEATAAPETAAAGGHSAHQGAAAGSVQSDPPMTMGMFAGLNALSGLEYEIAWLEAMIDHHDDALHMAERILEASPERVGHENLRTLAQQIISDQTAEIEAMEALIVELSR